MSLPTGISTATVTGTFVNADGSPCSGTVTFDPAPCYWIAADSDTTIMAEPIVATLDANGTVLIEVQATDDDDLNPVDWTYRVRVNLSDCHKAFSFDMAAPSDTMIDLSDVVPVIGTVGNAIIVGPEGVVVRGTLIGAATPLPADPAVGDLWVLGSPVPSAAPVRADGSAAHVNDGIVWTVEDEWVNTGPVQGPQGEWTSMTQAEFDAMAEDGLLDPNTLYVIKG